MQLVVHAFCFPLLNDGNNNAARIAMMAITTSNSISVKACCLANGLFENIFCMRLNLTHPNLSSQFRPLMDENSTQQHQSCWNKNSEGIVLELHYSAASRLKHFRLR